MVGKIKSFFSGVKTEFKKIVWPDRFQVLMEFAAVMLITAVLGCVIVVLDLGIQYLVDAFVSLGSNDFGTVRTVISVILIISCIALTVLVMMQEGKTRGLSALSGDTDGSFWSKNRGRSKESRLKKLTAFFIAVMLILAAFLNTGII